MLDQTARDAHDDPATRWSTPAATIAVLLAVAFLALAMMVVGGGPLPVDTSVRAALGVGGPVGLVSGFLNEAGGAITWDTAVAIVAVVVFSAGRRREAFWFGGGVLAGEALSSVAKLVVDRTRPPGISVQDLVTQASYPSGHMTRTVITVGLLVLLLTRGGWARTGAVIAAIALALLMGLARIESGEHWPTDVLGAALLGGALIAAIGAVPVRLRKSAPARRQRAPLASPGAAPRP